MNKQDNKIYFGFFKNFKSADTLLFSGSPLAFASFRDLLKDYAGRPGTSVNFGGIPMFIKSNVDVLLKVLPDVTGMKKINDSLFEWGLGAKEFEQFINELDIFASAKDGDDFHQYFDCGTLDDVQVMVSIGEYDSEIFKDL